MNPNKMRARGMRGHPGLRMLHNVHAAAFHSSPARFCLRMLGKVVVEIESAIESRRQRLAVKNDCADERGSVIAAFLQQFGQRGMRRRQRNGKIGDAMSAGQQSGQNAGVRGIGDRTGGECLGEANALSASPSSAGV